MFLHSWHLYIFDKVKKDLMWRILIDDDYLYGFRFHAAIVFGLEPDVYTYLFQQAVPLSICTGFFCLL